MHAPEPYIVSNLHALPFVGLAFLQDMSTLDQKMYPEIMGVTYVVNAPWIFGVIWKVIYELDG